MSYDFIGEIGNETQGWLAVKEENNHYYWSIQTGHSTDQWEEIPKYLYDSLVKYENERSNNNTFC